MSYQEKCEKLYCDHEELKKLYEEMSKDYVKLGIEKIELEQSLKKYRDLYGPLKAD